MTPRLSRCLDGLTLAGLALEGDRRAIARLLTLVENGHPEGQIALARLFSQTGRAHIVGFTGSTGVGKSTLVNRVAVEFRQRVPSLAVVAVDPTSPFSGGALLGDRLRMRDLMDDPAVFIRSMASRGHPGGIAHATRDVVTVLDALGYPVILVETVGAGQVQVDIARLAHTVVLVEAPGMGDDVQMLKAGLMEIADVIVVNKADRPEARQTMSALRAALREATRTVPAGAVRPLAAEYAPPTAGQGPGPTPQASEEVAPWAVPIVEASALEGWGVDAVVDAITAHRHHLEAANTWQSLHLQRAQDEVAGWLQRYVQILVERCVGTERLGAAADAVVRRDCDPASAARELVDVLLECLRSGELDRAGTL